MSTTSKTPLVSDVWRTRELGAAPESVRKRWGREHALTARTTAPGEALWQVGDRPAQLAVLLSGDIQLEEIRGEKTVAIRALAAPAVVGWSVVAGEPHSATARAVTEVHWTVIERGAFRQLIELAPEVAFQGFVTLGRGLASASARTRGESPTRTNVAAALVGAFDAAKAPTALVSVKDLAIQNGVRQPRISAVLAALEAAGAIRRAGSAGTGRRLRIELVDLEVLKKAAGVTPRREAAAASDRPRAPRTER